MTKGPVATYLSLKLSGACSSDKSMVSNENLVFVKALNIAMSAALIFHVTPSTPMVFARVVHFVGATVFGLSASLNLLCLLWLQPRRPSRSFNPLSIIWMMLSIPILLIIDFVYTLCAAPMYVAYTIGLPTVVFLLFRRFGVHEWFESSIICDVWLFHLIFLCRKIRWLYENLRDQKDIVAYFKTTCWFRVTRAPVAELIYAATTGHVNTFALQVGKLFALIVCQHLGCLAFLQAIFVTGALVRQPFLYIFKGQQTFEILNLSFMRQHKFAHVSAEAYITMHFEHHDVVPVASIGAASTGFQESVFRCLGMAPHYGTLWNGYNGLITYFASALDEWEHNYCPTAARSGVIATQFIHLEHHMNHTLPLGTNAEDEAKYNTGWSWDKSLWENIQQFAPDVHFSYEADEDIARKYVEGKSTFINLPYTSNTKPQTRMTLRDVLSIS